MTASSSPPVEHGHEPKSAEDQYNEKVLAELSDMESGGSEGPDFGDIEFVPFCGPLLPLPSEREINTEQQDSLVDRVAGLLDADPDASSRMKAMEIVKLVISGLGVRVPMQMAAKRARTEGGVKRGGANKEQNMQSLITDIDSVLLQLGARTPEFAHGLREQLVGRVPELVAEEPRLKTRLQGMGGEALKEIAKSLESSNDEDYRLEGLMKALLPNETFMAKHLTELLARASKIHLLLTKLQFYREYQIGTGQNSWASFKEDLTATIHIAGAREGAAAAIAAVPPAAMPRADLLG